MSKSFWILFARLFTLLSLDFFLVINSGSIGPPLPEYPLFTSLSNFSVDIPTSSNIRSRGATDTDNASSKREKIRSDLSVETNALCFNSRISFFNLMFSWIISASISDFSSSAWERNLIVWIDVWLSTFSSETLVVMIPFLGLLIISWSDFKACSSSSFFFLFLKKLISPLKFLLLPRKIAFVIGLLLFPLGFFHWLINSNAVGKNRLREDFLYCYDHISYTHLTLHTKRIV